MWVGEYDESGFGQDAVDQSGLVLDLAQAAADGGDQVVRVGERGLARLRRSSDQIPSTGLRSGL